MLRAGMKVARFNFSHGEHAYHQQTLDNLRKACASTGLLCGVLLDTKGPEIRTGFLKDGCAVTLEAQSEVTLTTDYGVKGDARIIAVSYPSLAKDVKPGSKILAADGSITFTVLSWLAFTLTFILSHVSFITLNTCWWIFLPVTHISWT